MLNKSEQLGQTSNKQRTKKNKLASLQVKGTTSQKPGLREVDTAHQPLYKPPSAR